MGLHNDEQYILYGGDVILNYNDEQHLYTRDGKVVPSTTQITKAAINKEFLNWWASVSAGKFIAKQWRPDTLYSQNEIDGILKASAYHYKTLQNRAADNGNYAHLWIEDFVNHVLKTGDKDPDLSQFEIPYTMRALNSVAAFLTWYYENDVEFIVAEQKVYSLEYNYSGTFDLLALVNGVLTIVDFKTSKDIYENYYIQGAAYVHAYHEEIIYRHPPEHAFVPEEHSLVQQFMVLHIPKNGDNYKTGTISTKDLEPYFEVFKSCRGVYDWVKKHEDNPWGNGSYVKATTTKGKGNLGIFFPEYQS